MKFTCAEVARAALGEPPRSRGKELLYRCPNHDDKEPSLQVNTEKNCWLCGPCGQSGNARELAAFLARLDFSDNAGITGYLRSLGLQRGQAKRRIVKEYPYLDERGHELFRLVRYEPKAFRYRQENEWSLSGVRLVLYHLPSVQSAEEVWIVEGEKDADSLQAWGLVATTNPMGAGKWRPEYSESLDGKIVNLIPDNDEPGERHATDVGRQLVPVAREVRIVRLPGLPAKGDFSDWQATGGRKEDLMKLRDAAPLMTSEGAAIRPASTQIAKSVHPDTDAGNADRLIRHHGDRIRFCAQMAKWLVWDRMRWKLDDDGEMSRLALQTVLSIRDEARDAGTSDERQALDRWAKRSASESRLRAMVSLAASDRRVLVKPDQLDADPWLLNCTNGTLELRTCLLHTHSHEDLCTKLCPVDYITDAQCPLWRQFLETITGGDKELQKCLQTCVGYALTGSTREQKIFVLYGTGANGKSTFIETIQTMLGEYARSTPFSTFLAFEESSTRNDLARLAGSRLVTASEIERGRRLSEVTVKQITGGDRITARFLYSEYFEFLPQFKVFLAVNHKPPVRGTEHALWRRLRLIPFTVTIPEDQQDKQLTNKLQREMAGILRWAVEGCREWQNPGLHFPQAVLDATREYREEMDILRDFIEARCVLESDAVTLSADLYVAYRRFCDERAEDPLKQNQFGVHLEERGLRAVKTGKQRQRAWRGIALHPNAIAATDEAE